MAPRLLIASAYLGSILVAFSYSFLARFRWIIWWKAMPVLLWRRAEAAGPSRYVSTASRYILRAIRISPRSSGERVTFSRTVGVFAGLSKKLVGATAGAEMRTTIHLAPI